MNSLELYYITSKFTIFFLLINFLNYFKNNNFLKVNVLCVEYPGYGIYKGSSNSDLILRDSEIIFDFLVDIFNYNPSNIFLFGRSIGSGPSTHLAAVRRPGLLVLMSPFTSIRDVARSMCGNVCVLLAERF